MTFIIQTTLKAYGTQMLIWRLTSHSGLGCWSLLWMLGLQAWGWAKVRSKKTSLQTTWLPAKTPITCRGQHFEWKRCTLKKKRSFLHWYQIFTMDCFLIYFKQPQIFYSIKIFNHIVHKQDALNVELKKEHSTLNFYHLIPFRCNHMVKLRTQCNLQILNL